MINQQKLKASQEQLTTAQIKDEESQNDVARGNALEISTLQSRAAILQAQQESLTLRLQGNDLRRQLADVLALPVETPLELDPGAAAVAEQVVKVRTEAARLSDRQVEQNAALNFARSQSHSDLASATASLLEANCGLSLTEAERE